FPTRHSTVIDPMPAERRHQFEEFMRICKDNDIELTVIFTPEYVDVENPADPNNAVNEAVRMAGNFGFKVYCDTRLEPFASSPELFYDNSHINVRGTKIYTDTILNRIR
ncbi:MAG: hypothetical protein K2M12_01650, partial [Muribaculaceae bacterium]|nr:hypothetical protein [Muribaculaceae bacterium]